MSNLNINVPELPLEIYLSIATQCDYRTIINLSQSCHLLNRALPYYLREIFWSKVRSAYGVSYRYEIMAKIGTILTNGDRFIFDAAIRHHLDDGGAYRLNNVVVEPEKLRSEDLSMLLKRGFFLLDFPAILRDGSQELIANLQNWLTTLFVDMQKRMDHPYDTDYVSYRYDLCKERCKDNLCDHKHIPGQFCRCFHSTWDKEAPSNIATEAKRDHSYRIQLYINARNLSQGRPYIDYHPCTERRCRHIDTLDFMGLRTLFEDYMSHH